MPASWSAIERAQLAAALTAAGPDAPTLCEGWQTRHLATHIVVRDRRPWAWGRLESLAERARTPEGYAAMVADVAQGPGRLAPGHWADAPMNLLEFYVHTQDVVRAQPGALHTPVTPEQAEALWKHFRLFSKALLRPVPTGVILVVDDGPRTVARRPSRGQGNVIIKGAVEELVLFGFGRGAHTDVTFTGEDADVAALRDHFAGRADDATA
jgi:uncharacterized protein (TIGR03085 family)